MDIALLVPKAFFKIILTIILKTIGFAKFIAMLITEKELLLFVAIVMVVLITVAHTLIVLLITAICTLVVNLSKSISKAIKNKYNKTNG